MKRKKRSSITTNHNSKFQTVCSVMSLNFNNLMTTPHLENFMLTMCEELSKHVKLIGCYMKIIFSIYR